MTPLHLIRIPVRLGALARWAHERGWVRTRKRAIVFDEGRALHHLLAESLGGGVLQPYRLLCPPRGRAGNIYGYSVSDAVALRAAVRIQALPETLSVLCADRIESKVMTDTWFAGQRIGFDLRVRPVRRLNTGIEVAGVRLPKNSEIDAFLREAWQCHPEAPNGMEKANRSRESVYLDWLAERMAPAATVDVSATRLVRFQRTVVARGKRAIEGPDAIFHGTLAVTDASAFSKALAGGIGRHKAYGFGMLLLRPPNKPVLVR